MDLFTNPPENHVASGSGGGGGDGGGTATTGGDVDTVLVGRSAIGMAGTGFVGVAIGTFAAGADDSADVPLAPPQPPSRTATAATNRFMLWAIDFIRRSTLA
jgi:hypothetical protein